MTWRSLRIVVPACNEEHRIESTLRDYCMHFADSAVIVVVANGCTDATAEIVRQLQTQMPNLRLIEISGRIGKGGAVRVGLATAAEHYAGFTDADGSTPAAEFMRLYEHCKQSGADAVIGSRWLPGARLTPAQPILRRFASRVFNAVVRVLFGLPFADTQCGAKIFKRSALSEILHSLEAADFAFDIEVLWRLIKHGFRVREIPTVWSDRCASTVTLLPAAGRMLATIARMRLRESVLWRIPYCDVFARRRSIPVRSSPHVLVLGEPGPLQTIVDALDRCGARVTYANHAIPPNLRAMLPAPRTLLFKAAFTAWYIFASRREYDAIVEFAGGAPAMLPAFSIKPTFVIDRRSRARGIAGALCRALYRRSRMLATRCATADDIGAAVLEVAEAQNSPTAFYHVDGRLTIAYRDVGSGRRIRQELNG